MIRYVVYIIILIMNALNRVMCFCNCFGTTEKLRRWATWCFFFIYIFSFFYTWCPRKIKTLELLCPKSWIFVPVGYNYKFKLKPKWKYSLTTPLYSNGRYKGTWKSSWRWWVCVGLRARWSTSYTCNYIIFKIFFTKSFLF